MLDILNKDLTIVSVMETIKLIIKPKIHFEASKKIIEPFNQIITWVINVQRIVPAPICSAQIFTKQN